MAHAGAAAAGGAGGGRAAAGGGGDDRKENPKWLPLAKHVAAEVARRLSWSEEVRVQFQACGINGRKVMEVPDNDMSVYLKSFPHAELALGVLRQMKGERLDELRLEALREEEEAASNQKEAAQADGALPRTVECHDFYLGRRLRLPLDQRAQVDAPLHVIAAAAARLHLPRGYPLALELPPPPSGYMRVPLWPAQLQRAAIGFAAAASHGLATAPASVDVSARTTWRWRTRILLRVMGGCVSRARVRTRLRGAVDTVAAARCARHSPLGLIALTAAVVDPRAAAHAGGMPCAVSRVPLCRRQGKAPCAPASFPPCSALQLVPPPPPAHCSCLPRLLPPPASQASPTFSRLLQAATLRLWPII